MKIAMLLSGGVDSSVALAVLVREQKHQIQAFYLKIWLEDELQYLGHCPWEEDLHYAQAICEQLGVPLEIVSLQTAYWDRVVAHSIKELKAGRTPSPDILCNQNVKFGAFCDLIDASYERIATGHYARQQCANGHQRLLKGVDPIKDQTYFLSRLSQDQLDRSLFPIGHLAKSEVRSLAASLGLATKDRPDSQGICFLGKLKFSEFVKAHLGEKRGLIIEVETGRELGYHQGFWFHTIGQRRGLGLSGGPWFVVQKDAATNIVYVSTQESRSLRPQLSFTISHMHWLGKIPDLHQSFSIKIRHGAHTTVGRLTDLGEARLGITLEAPDGGLAPGQYAVIYDADVCLGAGIID